MPPPETVQNVEAIAGGLQGGFAVGGALAASAAKAGKWASVGGRTAKAGDEITETSGHVGARVTRVYRSLRDKYLGRTPGKTTRTGQKVKERMALEDKYRIDPETGKEIFMDSKGVWRDISEADMAHKTDAVKWWNETGRKFGARAPEVRQWMLNPDNYYLEYRSINRSQGAIVGKTNRYLPPLK